MEAAPSRRPAARPSAPRTRGERAAGWRLAIVIPTIDEVDRIDRAVGIAHREADQVIVVDGGSIDSTRERAGRAGATVVVSPPGRGIQLNRGAQETTADIILFLHADTQLPEGAGDRVRQAIEAGAVGGGFRVRFDSRRKLMPLGGRIVNLRTRLTGCPLGDQAQFVSRAAFEALGGFRDWPILEDLDFARRLRRLGPTKLIDPPVITAARRYLEQGVVRTIATNWLIWGLYFAGVSPERLARLYRNVR